MLQFNTSILSIFITEMRDFFLPLINVLKKSGQLVLVLGFYYFSIVFSCKSYFNSITKVIKKINYNLI